MTDRPLATEEPFAVRVENLGKRYRIGAVPRGATLYDKVSDSVLRRRNRRAQEQGPAIWALRDISFKVAPGEVLGLIGRNGAGKSTLLKILARTTVPTEGTAITHGRVAALLKVGTGFHPELTGRENIKMSGAILGMSRAEIADVQDAIVDFAEIDRFLDTAVKYYSSGMYVRLAFSVSIHLAAEIMLIDEVLAVGDAGFRRKCEQRIKEAVSSGRTVLFVSHSMGSIEALCDRAMVLDGGQIRFLGTPREAIELYQSELVGISA